MITTRQQVERVEETGRPEPGCVFAGQRLTARAGIALASANVRYWTTVAPVVRTQLRRWESRARTIPDPTLRAIALRNLREEGFNAEAATTLATLTPRARRAAAVEAIAALQIMYDYLDGILEQPAADPLRNGRQLLRALSNVFTDGEHDYYRLNPRSQDGGYLQALVATARDALAGIPMNSTLTATARQVVKRCAEGQARAHATTNLGTAQLEDWARREAVCTVLDWRDFLAGALTSVMTVYALIATAGECTSPAQVTAVDNTYLAIGALCTLLDSLVDRDHDLASESWGYRDLWCDRTLLAERATHITRVAATHARALPHPGHHLMTLVGAVAYYTSAPTATSEFARPVTRRIQRELCPLILPTLALLRAWRAAKRLWGRSPGEPLARRATEMSVLS
jgi:tetraprenyl-beta-curcumene synthase